MRPRLLRLLLGITLAIAGAIAGCGPEDGTGDEVTTVAPTTTTAPTASTSRTDATDGTSTSPTNTASETTTSTDASTTTTEVPMPTPPSDADPAKARAAVADLARRLGVDEDAIVVVGVEEVMWRDGSLGCPEPGRVYTQALVEGERIVLSVDGREYAYHAGRDGEPFYCPPERAQEPQPAPRV